MTANDTPPPEQPTRFHSLRDRATTLLLKRGGARADPGLVDLKHILNELQTHQIELELQNDELQRTQRSLSQSRDQFASLYEFAPVPYFALDAKRKVISANLAAEQLLGIMRDRLIGAALSQFIEPGSQDRFHIHMQRLSRQEGPFDCELQIVTAKGECRSVSLRVQHVPGVPDHEYIAALVDITALKRAEFSLGELNRELAHRIDSATSALVQSQMELRRLIRGMVERQEQQTRNLARELHDTFGQDIAAVSLRLGNLTRGPGVDGSVAATLDDVMGELRRISNNLRDVSRQIHPKIIEDLGLEAAIRRECELLANNREYPLNFEAEELPEEPPSEISLACYRILQEGLRNALHHAGPVEVNVKLGIRQAQLYLCIADGGSGFSLEHVRRKGGLGLVSMEERSRLVNGDLRIESAPGKGTLLEFLVPMTG